MGDGCFPFDMNGVWSLPQQPERKLVNEFLHKRGVEYGLMHEILSEKFYKFV
jgi:hypothetical protein